METRPNITSKRVRMTELIAGKGSTNVIPDEVYIKGTFRTMDKQWRAEAHELMQRPANGLVTSMGGFCEMRIEKGFPFLMNSKALALGSRCCTIEYLGKDNLVDLSIRMTAENFSYFSQEITGCFWRLGLRNGSRG